VTAFPRTTGTILQYDTFGLRGRSVHYNIPSAEGQRPKTLNGVKPVACPTSWHADFALQMTNPGFDRTLIDALTLARTGEKELEWSHLEHITFL